MVTHYHLVHNVETYYSLVCHLEFTTENMSDARKTAVLQFSGHHSYFRHNFHVLFAVYKGQIRAGKMSACHEVYLMLQDE